MMTTRTKRYLAALCVALLLTVANVAVLNTSDIVNVSLLFGGSIIAQLLLLILITFFLIVVLRTPLRIIVSIFGSALKGIEGNTYIKRASRRFPFVLPWLKRRFSVKHPKGLILTIGVAVAALFAIGFVAVAWAVIFHSLYVGVDQRVVNLMPYIRTPAQNSFFGFFTFMASLPMVAVFAVVVGAIAWFRRQYWLPIILVGAALVQAAILEILKLSIQRPRPDISLRLLAETNFSFPSGHTLAATVVYGLSAYFLFRFTKAYTGKLLIVLASTAFIVLVATSRVYFGVHYPTDVIASILVGGFILTIFITALEINQRYKLVKGGILSPTIKKTLYIALSTLGLLGIMLSGPLTRLQSNTSLRSPTALSSIDQTTVSALPLYSETLTGLRMEPVNIIFIGSDDQLKKAFTRAGWYQADPSTPGNTFHAFLSAAKNEQYLNAPVTPSYLNFKPETVAFEKPTSTNSLRQRHHTRIWKTNFVVNGEAVWVATASLDRGIGIGSRVALPTHHIDPNVDNERNYISESLGQAKSPHVKVVDPQDGHNASGDSFFTDGRAVVISL